MKTIGQFLLQRAKNFLAALFSLAIFFHVHSQDPRLFPGEQGDSLTYLTFQGRIFDSTTGEALVFANIYLVGTQIGTVTNSDGEFLIKVPGKYASGKLGISSMGFRTLEIPLSGLDKEYNNISLEMNPIPIPEVTIVRREPLNLVLSALSKIPHNYGQEPVMMTGFYRETIRKNRNYVSVSEAVLDAYKSSYTNDFEFDRVRMYKGRRSMDVSRLDTLVMKLQGGPYTSFLLDEVKNRENIFPPDLEHLYEYQMKGMVSINDRLTYVVAFDQKPAVDYPLFKGRIYIDVDKLAVVAMEFSTSDRYREEITPYYIVKRPPGLRAMVEDAGYIVRFREDNGKWFLNYVRTELQLWVRWNKKLFRSSYTIVSEMAVTDIEKEKVVRFPMKEAIRLSDVLVDKIGSFSDPEYWGEYNVIKPEESIEAAIEKMGRRLKRE